MPKKYLDADSFKDYLQKLKSSREKEAENFATDKMFQAASDWASRATGLSSVLAAVDNEAFEIEDLKPIDPETVPDTIDDAIQYLEGRLQFWIDKYWDAPEGSMEEKNAAKYRHAFELLRASMLEHFPKNEHGVRKQISV